MENERIFCSLPRAYSLVGSNGIPEIDDQGAIGSCASQSDTRNQFSNAVTRYAHMVRPDCRESYVFSPKFTYNFSGAGTAWVYEALIDHGCLPESECMFEKNENGGHIKEKDGKLAELSSEWPVSEGQMKKALENRLTGFEQIWMSEEKYHFQLTTTEEGRALLAKIKKAVVEGNCVVTGGYPGRWIYSELVNTGSYGKPGDKAIVAAAGDGGGGHQVTIVGYDDDVSCSFAGVTLKGAFIIANSYGKKWVNGGYTYAMYDCVNTVSEYPGLNKEEIYSGQMFLTLDTEAKMYSEYLSPKKQMLCFEYSGKKVRLGENDYPSYYIKDRETGRYLTYSSDSENRKLTVSNEKDEDSLYVLVSYRMIFEFEGTNRDEYKEEYGDSYWIYAVNRGDAPVGGYRIVDAGVSVSANGRNVGIASINGGRYPMAKSFDIDELPGEGDFESRLGITAGKDVKTSRIWTFDQFCFTDYRRDIVFGLPELYADIVIEVDDRESFAIVMTRKAEDGTVEEYMPAMFRYGRAKCHPKLYKGDGYLTFSAKINGAPEKGHFTLSYGRLLDLPEGKNVLDYSWGFEIIADKDNLKFHGAKLFRKGSDTFISSLDGTGAVSKKAAFWF